MAIAWHYGRSGAGAGGHLELAEELIPAEGWRVFARRPWSGNTGRPFSKGATMVAYEKWRGAPNGQAGYPKLLSLPTLRSQRPLRSHHNRRNRTPAKADKFLTPHSSQWANPLAKGWALVEAIREGLRDGSLPYNRKQSRVQVDRKGELPAGTRSLRVVLRAPRPGRSPKTLVNQFGRLNICTRTRKGKNLLRGGRRNQKQYQQGFVVEDPNLFWDGEPRLTSFISVT